MPNTRSRSRSTSAARIPDTIEVDHIPGHGDRFRDTSTGRFVADSKVVEVEYSMKGSGSAPGQQQAQSRSQAQSHSQSFSNAPIPDTIEVDHIPGHGDRFRDTSTGRFVADSKVVEVEYSMKGSGSAAPPSAASSRAATSSRASISSGAISSRTRSHSRSAPREPSSHGRYNIPGDVAGEPQQGQAFKLSSSAGASDASGAAAPRSSARGISRSGSQYRDASTGRFVSASVGEAAFTDENQLKGQTGATQAHKAKAKAVPRSAISRHTRSHSRGKSAQRGIGEETYYYH